MREREYCHMMQASISMSVEWTGHIDKELTERETAERKREQRDRERERDRER